MSVCLQCHHALVDGSDAALFLERLRSLADAPEKVFGALSSGRGAGR